ncbi:hypothetical protein HRR83_002157 [Exophiala dermatitidis]|nr:hypothetical protein HRR74_002234 [Exophiala dermatitidis]KAJ4525690.1 hypothetical protein HRR73_002422 [Exophiala dermatitidis]KAJ4537014.1 hypothetical protein HRR76_005034 [Exophiala dermatitidis]KAJ4555388.1 hypothetical protein HRR77_001321 [Exophiala dermatitidis]KAJ4572298.1 hypothetical protein HRR79_003499 [Exophiala dermatitidis]
MDALKNLRSNLRPRDSSDLDDDVRSTDFAMGHLLFVFFGLLLIASILSFILLCLRRKRLARERALLPTYQQPTYSHHRSPSINNLNQDGKNESIFVYDEKMNLIHNSSSPASTAVPEIHITFPDEAGNSGNKQQGRVVVVHITESGSVGMEPLHREPLPPYQKEDADRFQSLDLDRIGGLKEKEPLGQRWS